MPARREDTDRLPAILGLDHVMVMVGDLDAASAEAENAGFTLSSPSVMPGLVNRLICFADAPPGATSFIEFLQITDNAQVPPAVLEVLGERLGPAAIVVAVDDMARYCAHLDTIGIGHSGPMSIRRQWPVGEGGTLDVHLEVVLPDPAELPVPCVAVRHHTPHHYRRREFVTHANAMVAMPAVAVQAPDPGAAAAVLGRLFGIRPTEVPDGSILEMGGTFIVIRNGPPGIVGVCVSETGNRDSVVLATQSSWAPFQTLSGLQIARSSEPGV